MKPEHRSQMCSRTYQCRGAKQIATPRTRKWQNDGGKTIASRNRFAPIVLPFQSASADRLKLGKFGGKKMENLLGVHCAIFLPPKFSYPSSVITASGANAQRRNHSLARRFSANCRRCGTPKQVSALRLRAPVADAGCAWGSTDITTLFRPKL